MTARGGRESTRRRQAERERTHARARTCAATLSPPARGEAARDIGGEARAAVRRSRGVGVAWRHLHVGLWA